MKRNYKIEKNLQKLLILHNKKNEPVFYSNMVQIVFKQEFINNNNKLNKLKSILKKSKKKKNDINFWKKKYLKIYFFDLKTILLFLEKNKDIYDLDLLVYKNIFINVNLMRNWREIQFIFNRQFVFFFFDLLLKLVFRLIFSMFLKLFNLLKIKCITIKKKNV